MKRGIGVHVRLDGTLMSAFKRMRQYAVPFFQCFLVYHKTGRLIKPEPMDVEHFLAERRTVEGPLYVHGSYWINLAGTYHQNQQSLYREAYLARRLEFTHMVVHAGSAKAVEDKQRGIEAVARSINKFVSRESSLILILENTAHGGLSIGGDLHDFQTLLPLLDKPERVAFCIDTAHAHSYGYELCTSQGRQDFIQLLDSAIGLDRIVLLHLNDTKEACGSKIDRHEVIGDGVIGGQALKDFVLDEQLKQIPLLMELPSIPEEQELAVINMVRAWHQ